MELRQLQLFYTAAQTLNFTRTGDKLGYSQSNVTGQIRNLEEDLQVKLFERMGRGLQLTPEGKAFLAHVEQILSLCERAKGELSTQVFRGSIRIGAAETLCVHRLPKILTAYRHTHPLVEISVQTDSSDQLLQAIRDNSVDVALVLTDRVKSPDMIVHPLFDEQLTAVVSPAHRLANHPHLSPKDLAGECLILTAPGCGYRPLILSALGSCGVKPGSIMDFSSVGAIRECTACGLGVAFLPAIAVADELARHRLVSLPWTGPAIRVRTQLLYHQEKWLTPALKAFLELCADTQTR